MTVRLMSILTRRQLSNLNRTTRSEYVGYQNNLIQIVLSHAENLLQSATSDDDRESARAIVKTAQRWKQELDELFAERPPESVGAEGGSNCERIGRESQ